MPISLMPRLDAGTHQAVSTNLLLERVRDFDWSSSPAGPVDNWAEEVRSICRTTLLSTTPMAVLIGHQGVVLANEAIRNVFGPNYDHGLGKPVSEVLLHSGAFVQQLLKRAFEGNSSRFHDIALPVADENGTRQAWFDLDFTPIVDQWGTVHGALVICIETTQRVKALRELESSRERLELALASGGVVGVWEVDFINDIVRSDERYALLHNVDPSVAAAGAHRDVFTAGIHPEDREQVMEAFERAKLDGIYRCQHRVVGSTGTRWIVASGRVKRNSAGQPTTFTGTAVDITEQIEISAALSDSEKRFRTYAETLPHIIFGWNPEGRTIYANRRWNEFSGCSDDDPRFADWQSFIHPDDRIAVNAEWMHAMAARDRLSIEARHLHVSGVYRWMRAVALPIYDSNDLMSGWIGTLTDVHEEKLVEAERELISKELDHRIKNFFALTRGLVNLTSREGHDANNFAERLLGRLTALHHSHELVRKHSRTTAAGGEALHALIHHLLAPYLVIGRTDYILVEGDDITINPHEATAFALVLHELATNAAKYGALSSENGKLRVLSRHRNGILSLLWDERGCVRPLQNSDSGGFGSRMIQTIIERQLNGSVVRLEDADGIKIRLEIPRT